MIKKKVRKKERPVLMLIFSTVSQKKTRPNKIWSLKSLAMLKCETRTSLHAVATRLCCDVLFFLY